ncbi:imidazole glycerol phosphate synthase cyclase subunit [Dehalococcoidia bacterium]|nr:imidazole glycerol phosphate synthase cyclase subunit [Dehalococcoidia bacterium]
MTVRIIPRLDIKGPNLVKGIHMEGLRVLGKPENFARHYYQQGADELLYMDVVASLYQRDTLLDIVAKTATEVFIPLTVGGGLRTIEDIRTVLRAGADKVALNTAVIHDPGLIREAARRFGSSTITVSIEVTKKPDGTYEAYTDYGRESTGVNAVEWAVKAAEIGAGELIITSIDREGTGKGFDLELTRQIAEAVPIPVIACGGAGSIGDIYNVVNDGKADAVCAASVLHYNFLKSHVPAEDFSGEGNTEYLKSQLGFSKISDAAIPDIKQHLIDNQVSCRPPNDGFIAQAAKPAAHAG